MAATSTPLTVTQFLDMDLPEDQKHELIGGEIVSMERARRKHEKVKANALKIFVPYTERNRKVEVYCETLFQLTEEHGLIPDVALLATSEVVMPDKDAVFDCAPALAVEVVSSESAVHLEEKVETYLNKGTRTVLLLYPSLRVAMIREHDRNVRILRGDELVEIDWLPGFSVPASRFFEGL